MPSTPTREELIRWGEAQQTGLNTPAKYSCGDIDLDIGKQINGRETIPIVIKPTAISARFPSHLRSIMTRIDPPATKTLTVIHGDTMCTHPSMRSRVPTTPTLYWKPGHAG